MTTATETEAKTKQVPDFYVFENGPNGEKGGKPAKAEKHDDGDSRGKGKGKGKDK